jgi:hypothetical protein
MVPKWEPQKWEKYNMKYNNCYAYSVNDLDFGRNRKPVPGPDREHYDCSDIMMGLYEEIPGIYNIDYETKCNDGYFKIFSVVSNEPTNNDFHFYREDRDQLWSHKPGSNKPTRLDSDGNIIINPELSNRNFTNRNYSKICGYFCVPTDPKNIT